MFWAAGIRGPLGPHPGARGSSVEKAQEPRGEQGSRPQAFVHGGLSREIFTVAPFTDGDAEARGQEGPARAPPRLLGRTPMPHARSRRPDCCPQLGGTLCSPSSLLGDLPA